MVLALNERKNSTMRLNIDKIYSKLLCIQLFTGMSRDELQSIMRTAKIDFKKVNTNEIIVHQGDRAGRLLILLDGCVSCIAKAPDGTYSITETIKGPTIIGQECMFGRFQEFNRTVTALTSSSAIEVEKAEVMKIMDISFIFRINLINSLSTALQKHEQELWLDNKSHASGHGLEYRIINFIRQRCVSPVGPKICKINRNILAEILNTKHYRLTQALNNLADTKLVKLTRGKIYIPELHALADINI